jgi:hypothetical protein
MKDSYSNWERELQAMTTMGPQSIELKFGCLINGAADVAMRLSQQWSVAGYYRIIPSHGNNHWGGIGWMSRRWFKIWILIFLQAMDNNKYGS